MKTSVPESIILIKLQADACNFIKKETLAQVFSCEICAIFKNAFFFRTPSVASSDMTFIIENCIYAVMSPKKIKNRKVLLEVFRRKTGLT